MKKTLFLLLSLAIVSALPVKVWAISAEDRRAIVGNHVFYDDRETVQECNSGSVPVTSGTLDRFLQVLAYQESRGNPLAQARGSSASGKYQYIDSTWRSRASLYGPAGAYSRAYQAPEAIQDAVAYIEYTQKFRSLNGDLFRIIVSHYVPAALRNPALLDAIPPGNRLTPREYANRAIENINNGVGSDIPLRYREAPEFETWLNRVGGYVEGASGTPTETPTQPSNPSCNQDGSVSGAVSRVVELALAEVNKTESPLGSNCGPDLEPYFDSVNLSCGPPWCAVFIRYIFGQAGIPVGSTNSALQMGNWFRNNKFFFTVNDPYRPQPGDVYVKRRNGNSGQGHIGIVVEVNGYQIKTVDGNVANKVSLRTYSDYRTIPQLVGFGRYVDASQVQPESGLDPSTGNPTDPGDDLSEE